MADDYFAAMERVEQRLDITPEQESTKKQDYAVIKVQEHIQLLMWIDKLALPELCFKDRLYIIGQLQSILSILEEHPLPEVAVPALRFEKQLGNAEQLQEALIIT
jgi:hypothetical protein